MRITALAGGVGAAKFLRGLSNVTDADPVTIIGNTGDDCILHGLHISPDLDIVTYTLAGLIADQGWGIRDDTMLAIGQLAQYGIDPWFALGDRDLGTHMARTTWLAEGVPLSEVTDRLRKRLLVKERIIPMSDDQVRTFVTTQEGIERTFQDYFVRHKHAEDVASVRFEGAQVSSPAPGVIEALRDADMIIICPSNPVVSIGPILAVPGIREALANRKDDAVAISPIIEGAALKGPAARMLPLLGVEASAAGVARVYREICTTFVFDQRDSTLTAEIEGLGMKTFLTQTIMSTAEIAETLARQILAL